MEFPSNFEKSRGKTATSDHHATHSPNQHHKPSNSELIASAKVVADAAMHHGQNKFDKAEVAGAAADLLSAASYYGKLEEKPLGKVVEKAESYLNQYHTSHFTNSHHSSTTTTTTETTHTTNHPGKDHGHSGSGGYGEYIKIAEGLLNKHSGNSNSSGNANTHSSSHSGPELGHSGSDYAEYMKMAGDFLRKH